MSGEAVAAVDVGGTTLKGAVFSATGEVLVRRSAPTFGNSDSVTAGLAQLLSQLVDGAAARGATVAEIGIATPGLVDSGAGVVRYAANLGWQDFPLVSTIAVRFGRPVLLDNDARAAAIAELAFALPERLRDLLFVPIGTGVSAAVILDGIVLHGATGAAGELGHIGVVPGGRRCGCGQLGCVEAYASGSAILQRYLEAGGHASSAAEVVERLADDPRAASVWADAIDALAAGVAALTAALDPDVVILGGGVARAGDVLLAPLRAAVAERIAWRQPPSFRLAGLGSHAGLLGAALLGDIVTDQAEFVRRAISAMKEQPA